MHENIQFVHSSTEENYLKAIYKLQEAHGESVATSEIAKELELNAASVTDMLKKLAKKKFIFYQKMKGVRLSEKGNQVAVNIIRNHRLWEVFLVNKLGFGWDTVHEIAEQLEHIHNDELITRLDTYLGSPKADPHGDPIPDANGVFVKSKSVPLANLEKGSSGKFTGVTDHSASFLNYLDKLGLSLGDTIKVKDVEEFDKTYTLQLKGKKEAVVSLKVANSLLVSE